MRNLYTQIALAAVLASSTAKNITLARRASVEIGGVTHEVAASVEIPIDDGEGPEVVYIGGDYDVNDATRGPESSNSPSENSSSEGGEDSTLTDFHAYSHRNLFPPEYEQGVCQNIIYDH